jgi:hypothetical protein
VAVLREGVPRHVTAGNVLDPRNPADRHRGLKLGMQQAQEVRHCVLPAYAKRKENRLADADRRGPESFARQREAKRD